MLDGLCTCQAAVAILDAWIAGGASAYRIGIGTAARVHIFWVRILDDGTACLAFFLTSMNGRAPTHSVWRVRRPPTPPNVGQGGGLVGGERGVDPRASGAMCLGGLVVSSAARA